MAGADALDDAPDEGAEEELAVRSGSALVRALVERDPWLVVGR